jgi:HEAT repeat protein
MSESILFRLKDPNPHMREQTLMELVFDPDVKYLELLNSLVNDKDRDVRRTLMLALGALNHEGALAALMSSLLDDENDVVIAAEHALSKLGVTAQQALWAWTQDADWLKRKAAVQCLRHFEVNDLPVHTLIHDDIWEVRYAAYLLLASASLLHTDALNILLAALNTEENAQAREGIIYALGLMQTSAACEALVRVFLNSQMAENTDVLAQVIESYGDHVQPTLLKWGLWSEYPHLRALSAALLSQMKYADLESVLRPLLLDPAREVRETVAYALYQKTENPFWELLGGLYQENVDSSDILFNNALEEILSLSDPVLEEKAHYLLQVYSYMENAERRQDMVKVLTRMGAVSATPVFIEQLSKPLANDEIAGLIEALGFFGVRDAYAPIQAYFRVEELRNTVAEALCKIAPEAQFWQRFLQQEHLSIEDLQKLFLCLAELPEALPFLTQEALQKESMQRHGIALKGLLKYKQCFPTFDLTTFLDQYLALDASASEETLDVLIQMSECSPTLGQEAFNVGLSWLQLPSENLRRGGIYFLKPHCDAQRERILELLSHELWFVRQAALEMLAPSEEPEIIAAIRQALTDRDRDVRVFAVTLLGQLKTPERLDWLVDVLENGYREIRAVAARALAGFAPHSTVTEPLEIALVEDEAAEVRQAAVETLAHLKVPDLKDLIEETLSFEDDIQVSISAIRCLAVIDSASAYTWVTRLLKNDPELSVFEAFLPLFETYRWPVAVLQKALEQPMSDFNDEQLLRVAQLRIRLLPLLCFENPGLAKQSLYHEDSRVVAEIIQHLPAEMLIEERIWIKALWRQKNADIRRAIYMRWSLIKELWDDFAQLARQEDDLSLRQVLIEQIDAVSPDKALPLCESLFLKHTEQTQSPLIWSFMRYLQEDNLEPAALDSIFRVFSRSQDGVRAQMFAMLASVKGKHAFALLQMCLESWDQELLVAAIEILPGWEMPALEALIKIWPESQLATQMEILKALRRFSKPLLEAVFERLEPLFAQALEVQPLRPFLLEVLAQWDQETAAFLQGALRQYTEISQRALRYDIYAGLVTLFPETYLWVILREANSALANTRQRALVRLGLWLQRESSDPLWNTLDWHHLLDYFSEDESYAVRLSYYELPFSAAPHVDHAWRNRLIRGLRYDVLPIQQACIYQLRFYFEGPAEEELLSLWSEARFSLKETLLSVLSEVGMPGLSLDALSDESTKVRMTAVCIAGKHQLAHAEPFLIEQLANDAQDSIREACCWALGHLGTPRSQAVLFQTVEESHFSLQYQALRALRHIPGSAAFLVKVLPNLREDRELLLMALKGIKAQASQLSAEVPIENLMTLLEMTYDVELRKFCLAIMEALTSPIAQRYLAQMRG